MASPRRGEASPRRCGGVERHSSPQRLKNIDLNLLLLACIECDCDDKHVVRMICNYVPRLVYVGYCHSCWNCALEALP